MDNAIPQSIDLCPCHLLMLFLEIHAQFRCELSDLPEVKHTCLDEHIVGAKVFVRKTCAVCAYLLSIVKHLAKNNVIAHKSLPPFA